MATSDGKPEEKAPGATGPDAAKAADAPVPGPAPAGGPPAAEAPTAEAPAFHRGGPAEPEPVEAEDPKPEPPKAEPPKGEAPKRPRRDLLDALAKFPPLTALVLVAVCLALFLPGFFNIPPVDRDEARFAQASRQMVETRDFVDIRFQDEARHKKPAGIYWLQAASVEASGMGDKAPIWIYRMPSLVGAVLAVLLTWRIGAVLFGPTVGFVGALFFAAVILPGVEARLAKTDAMLLAAILAAQLVLARLWVGRKVGFFFTAFFYVALAAGVLLKGPIIVMVTGLTMIGCIVWKRSVRWLKPLASVFGVLLFLILAVPWFVAIGIRTDWAFYTASFGGDMLAKVAGAKESHGAPPGAYLLVALATLWPLSAFLPAGLNHMRRHPGNSAVWFCLLWVIPSWVIFELVPTKLPHYVLPLYPALALVIVAGVLETFDGHRPTLIGRIWSVLLFVLPVLVLAAVIAGAVYLNGTPMAFYAIPVVGLGVVVSLLAWYYYRGGHARVRFVATSLLAAAIVYGGALGLAAPAFSDLWISGRLAARIAAFDACPDPKVVSVGFSEPSLVFLSPRPVDFANKDNAAEAVGDTACGLLLVDARHQDTVMAGLSGLSAAPRELGREEGRNLNGGRALDIGVFAIGGSEGGTASD
ncbi:ArnT family glycosyltransferase [Rhodobium gokarnense]|uniref:4-amino-4-deoxy-L-arabinose transferase-like glycosyltransferase n=1 Tax=Rhodobium gokarnense TaxID=364296 RepID=A0ABT3HA99_9HYPH|nr:glycosyltransferase family 39 protein [Rhodobium gokarnense]MCW2307318.1 4-amino-4-deoxy-L-arabinose transferase-like glycosyltransferase [Rhodobium gokarnense]